MHNVVVVFDVYAVAHTREGAAEAVLEMIKRGELTPTAKTALEAREEANIREAWREERPFVSADVSDEEFEKLKGKTTIEIFRDLYTKGKKK